MGVPHTQPGVWPGISPDRFALGISTAESPPPTARIALLGLADDLGVRLNGGRPGAARGPSALRAALARYGTDWDGVHGRAIDPLVWDAGDIVPLPGDDAAALEGTHRRVSEACGAILAAGLTTVCIGGGHDLTFPGVRALAVHSGRPVGGVNIDPHLDVRPTPGSGMPFRALIEGGHMRGDSFSVLGAGRFANSREHVEWLQSRGGWIVPFESLRRDHRLPLADGLRRAGETRFVSFDLDSIDAAHAPAVSALNPCGLTPAEAVAIVRLAGADPRVRHFDLMELCPDHDEQGRTARLAAHLFLSFVSAFAGRSA